MKTSGSCQRVKGHVIHGLIRQVRKMRPEAPTPWNEQGTSFTCISSHVINSTWPLVSSFKGCSTFRLNLCTPQDLRPQIIPISEIHPTIMAPTIPKLLFRIWSDNSNGTNSRLSFRPASQCDQATPQFIHNFDRRLQQALLWKDVENNPFIFFSSSLIFVPQLAGWMKSKRQQNIYITCVDAETATTTAGLPVTFYSVNALLQQFGIEITNRDGTKREYNHEYAALTAVAPTAGSLFIAFETLISTGLFDLCPQLQDVNNRHNVRLHIAVTDLQAFGFSTEQALSKERIDVAARLVFSFQLCSPFEATEANDGVEMPLFAWFLSLMKRNKNHATLNSWLESHSALILEDSVDAIGAPITGMEDPEFLQYRQILQHVEGRSLLQNKVESHTRISRDTIARDLAIWQT